MPDTPETSGGTVEHEVYMLEGIILIVIELKLYFKDLRDTSPKCYWNWHVSVPFILCSYCTESEAHVTQRHTDSTAPKNSTTNLPFMQS